jgi:hypothetical protein
VGPTQQGIELALRAPRGCDGGDGGTRKAKAIEQVGGVVWDLPDLGM